MSDMLEEGETNPSGMGDVECPSDHYPINDTVDNPCTSCGAQV